MYARELLRASFSLLALAFASFLVDASQAVISRGWAIVLAGLVLGGWMLFFWRFFRSTSMSLRQKICAWLALGVLFCAAMLIHSRYVDELTWRVQVVWYVSWLSISLLFVVIARFVAPAPRFPDTQFTVQSETPDHVVRVDGA